MRRKLKKKNGGAGVRKGKRDKGGWTLLFSKGFIIDFGKRLVGLKRLKLRT